MKGQIDTNRHNWRAHCKKPPLTGDEWRRWRTVAERIRADRDFADLVFDATEAEFQAEQATMEEDGWLGLARWADASKRYRRAVIDVGERLTNVPHKD